MEIEHGGGRPEESVLTSSGGQGQDNQQGRDSEF